MVSEPLTRLGAKVTGVDADPKAIQAAITHAKTQNLSIDYRQGAAEDLVKAHKKFDVVLGLEDLEHTSKTIRFCETVCRSCRAQRKNCIFDAELDLEILCFGDCGSRADLLGARGTHQWNKFIKPSELSSIAGECGLHTVSACGLVYSLVKGQFELSPHRLDVNYFMLFSPKKRS